MNPDEFNVSSKVFIKKSELSKAVNVGSQSDESEYVLTSRSHDEKKNREFEDKTAKEMDDWLEEQKKELTKELTKIYG